MIFQKEPGKRRDAGILQITERDILALTWIAEQFCISYDQLQRLLALYTPAITKRPDRVAPSTAQNAIERWLHLGFIEQPVKVIREHSTYVWLSRKGIRELELPYAYYQPKPSTLRHIYAVNAIRLHLQSQGLPLAWYSWRTLFHETELRPLPDAELRAHAAPTIAVQVIEQPLVLSSLRDACNALTSLVQRYTSLWYILHPQVATSLYDVVSMLDQEMQHHIRFSHIDMLEPFPW
jgi:hypothetical protein